MKRKVYIYLISVLMLAVLGCHREEPLAPFGEISFAPSEAGDTKAMLTSETFGAAGNQIRIYDYYFPKGADTPNATPYIPGTLITSNGNGSWPFEGGAKYDWTADGKHKFFGWLEKDAAMASDKQFTPTFDQADQTLTTPVVEVTPGNADVYDFMYSDTHWRDLDNNPYYTSVPLVFNHLYTSFSIAAYEAAKYNDYIIESVTVEGIKTKNSATIDYSGEQPLPTYGEATDPINFTLKPKGDDGFALTANLKDLATGELIPETTGRVYMTAWPQAARSLKLTIAYKVKDVSDPNADHPYIAYTKTITIPYVWEAGKRNNLNLEFKDKEISLTYNVEPWNKVTEEIEFSDQVMVEEHATIKWDRSTIEDVDYTTGEVIVKDNMDIEATCTFTILSPKGATWTASLIAKEGDPDAFRLSDGTKYGVVGGESTIKIVVTNQDPISPRHVCELLITVQTADGRTIVVDDALTPEYDEEGNRTTYNRFKIIQNFIN